jgi:hypothetical protein
MRIPGVLFTTMSFDSPTGTSFLLRTSRFAPDSPEGGEKYLNRGYRKEKRVVSPRRASVFFRNSRRFVMVVMQPNSRCGGRQAVERNYISGAYVCQMRKSKRTTFSSEET